MDEQANIELVKQCYEAYTTGDGPRLLGLMQPDIEWDIPEVPDIGHSGKRHGIAEVAEFFRLVSEGQELRNFQPQEFFAHGDRVVVLGHHDWTVRANHCDFGSDWVHIFTVKDGKVASFREVMDTQAIVAAYHGEAASTVPRAYPHAPRGDVARSLH
ncbi:MAG: nuclear transport factor 2 family protein [Telluria sp.]